MIFLTLINLRLLSVEVHVYLASQAINDDLGKNDELICFTQSLGFL